MVHSADPEALATLQTRLLTVARVEVGQSWGSGRVRPHQDPMGRLYWLRGGEARVSHGGRDYRLLPGRLYAIPAHTPFHYSCAGRMDQCYIHFEATLFGCLDPFDCLGWRLEASCDDDAEVDRLWDEALRRHATGGAAGLLAADGIFRQLLARLVPAGGGEGQGLPAAGRFRRVLEHMERRLAERIRLAELAELVYLQPTYFSNLFSATMGLPPMRYLNRRRVERARALLWLGGMSLEEVARAVGFGDQFYFSRVFSRETGLSPSEYRRQKGPEVQGRSP
ncbi:MAG: helix-turn-helix domain-containing protein [Planctomycetota bacterium]|jgi:AraC-like DNA-binding protein